MMKSKLLLLSAMAVMGTSTAIADDDLPVIATVGNASSTTQTASFDASGSVTLKFKDGKAVMVMGDGTTHIAEASIDHGAQLDLSFKGSREITNSISANVGSAGYTTLYSAFQMTVPSGAVVYVPTIDESASPVALKTVKLEEGTVIPVGTGIILKNQGTYTFPYTATENPASITSALSGSEVAIAKSSAASGSVYTISCTGGSVTFNKFTGDNLSANEAYLVLDESESASSVLVDFYDVADGVISIDKSHTLISGDTYNIMGQRVGCNAKGITITNGKKIFVK